MREGGNGDERCDAGRDLLAMADYLAEHTRGTRRLRRLPERAARRRGQIWLERAKAVKIGAADTDDTSRWEDAREQAAASARAFDRGRQKSFQEWIAGSMRAGGGALHSDRRGPQG